MATERTLSTFSALGAVNSPTRITLENNAKILPQPDRENAFARVIGGSIGIRTLETVPRLHTFQACAFDHSATDPLAVFSLPLSQGARGEADRDRGKRTLLQIVLDRVAFDGVPHTEGNSPGLRLSWVATNLKQIAATR